MIVRSYDPERDKEAVRRIWRETGWLEKDKEERQDWEIAAGPALVGELGGFVPEDVLGARDTTVSVVGEGRTAHDRDGHATKARDTTVSVVGGGRTAHDRDGHATKGGEAECLVVSAPGTLRYLAQDLPFYCVSGVTTSRVARKQGLGSRVTAASVAAGAEQGALVAGLGMFEQGYYNRLGFGCGAYEHEVTFDPAQLKVSRRARVPVRIGPEEWEAVHAARLARLRGHGGCNLTHPHTTRLPMAHEDGFGLGYRDAEGGALSHLVWVGKGEEPGEGHWVQVLVYRSGEEFLELMALLKSLGDEMHVLTMKEPAGLQLQDLMEKPFKQYDVTEGATRQYGIRSWAWEQVRMLDLPRCVDATHLLGPTVRFNLELSDPIEALLADEAPWRGVAGEYVVTLGPESQARLGSDPGLPLLRATVNAFTRLWMGVRPASGLAVTDDLSGPQELLAALDAALRLPTPRPGWGF